MGPYLTCISTRHVLGTATSGILEYLYFLDADLCWLSISAQHATYGPAHASIWNHHPNEVVFNVVYLGNWFLRCSWPVAPLLGILFTVLTAFSINLPWFHLVTSRFPVMLLLLLTITILADLQGCLLYFPNYILFVYFKNYKNKIIFMDFYLIISG